MKKAVERCRVQDIDKLRCIGLGLITQDGDVRSKEQREGVVLSVIEMIKDEAVRRKDEVILMPKPAFCAWYRLHLAMSEENAKARWKKDKGNPDHYRETRHGRLCLAVPQYTSIAAIETVSKRKRYGASRAEMQAVLNIRMLAPHVGRSEYRNVGGDALLNGCVEEVSLRIHCSVWGHSRVFILN